MRLTTQKRTALAVWACALSALGQSPPPAANSRTKWLGEAKAGLWIQWGLYSSPAGEWKGQMIPGPGEWIMHDVRIPAVEYGQLASGFGGDRFRAESWVKFFEEASIQYVVVTVKHHDGFAMYRSTVSKFNVFDATPFHRDPLEELAAVCAKHNIKLGIYYSLAQDWHERDGAGNDWDFGSGARDFDRYLREKAEPQLKELLTKYGPIAVVRFDTSPALSGERGQRFVNLVHSLQPAALVAGPAGLMGDYVTMDENHIPEAVVKGEWEVATTLNGTSGFKKFDNQWKSIDDVIFRLLDVASKGGNYVVNVGPTEEGVIPRPIESTLEEMGEWLKANGEAIHGAGPTAFGEEFADRKWRCTTKPGKLFITMFQWPDRPLELNNVKGRIEKAYLLTDPKHALLKFTQSNGRVSVVLPKDPPFEGEVPERMNPNLFMIGMRAHLHRVLVLETAR